MSILKKLKREKKEQADEKKTESTLDTKKQAKPKAKDVKKSKKTSSEKSEKKEVSKKRTISEQHQHVIVHPLVTEKSSNEETKGKYTFIVAADATKVAIKHAIKATYGVAPTKVRTMNYEGKRVRFGVRFGKRKDWKKAVVTLPKGKTIEVHEGV